MLAPEDIVRLHMGHFAAGRSHQPYPEWVDRFARYDPWRVLFAHDVAIWERGA